MLSPDGATLTQSFVPSIAPMDPMTPTTNTNALGSPIPAPASSPPPPPPGLSPMARMAAAASGSGTPAASRSALPSLGALGLPSLDSPSSYSYSPAGTQPMSTTTHSAPLASSPPQQPGDAYDMASFLRAPGGSTASAAAQAPAAAMPSRQAESSQGNFYSVEHDIPAEATAGGPITSITDSLSHAFGSVLQLDSTAPRAPRAAVAGKSDAEDSEGTFDDEEEDIGSGSGSWATESCVLTDDEEEGEKGAQAQPSSPGEEASPLADQQASQEQGHGEVDDMDDEDDDEDEDEDEDDEEGSYSSEGREDEDEEGDWQVR